MRRLVSLLGLFLLGAVAPPRPLSIVFESPAGGRPAGPIGSRNPYSQILPSGRIINPIGTSVVVGMNALGVAVTPDGRYAIVSNDDERQSDTVSALDFTTHGGYSLAVVDTRTMKVTDRYHNEDEQFFAGIAAFRDPGNPGGTLVLASGGPSNAVFAFDLDASGRLVPDVHHRIAVPTAKDSGFADFKHAFPAAIARSRDDAQAYVVNELSGSVNTIDTKTRSLLGVSADVGFFPSGAAVADGRVLVTNEGLMRYGKLAAPQDEPPFGNLKPDLEHASSLSLITIASDGSLLPAPMNLPMDPAPDGVLHIGGAHPTAVVASPNGAYAYVAMTNVDRVATVSLGPSPRVIGGTELRLYAHSPYGVQPDALALSRDGKRLYVALAGINAIAVLDAADPKRLHRIGLIPTGRRPSALALSGDDRYLFVTNAKGFNHDRGFQGDFPTVTDGDRILEVAADSNAVWATLQRIDLRNVDLRKSTRATLSYQHVTHILVPQGIVPQEFETKGSVKIKHVVLIVEEGKTYDAMLGDLTDAEGHAYGPGDLQLAAYDRNTTPNLHALARTFGVAGNFYADAEEEHAGQQYAFAGIASDYTERTVLLREGRVPLIGGNVSPEDYPRAGYIFNSLAHAKKTFRDYGNLLDLSGYDEDAASYTLDVPALAALGDHVDLHYPGRNAHVSDLRRAEEFTRDIEPWAQGGNFPSFLSIWLSGGESSAGKKSPSPLSRAAEADRALGTIVEYLTHTPAWRQTAIFIMPLDAQSARDHVNAHRTYAIVVSPYAKRRYIGARHLSTASVLKTEEELLGLPALSLGDMLAGDLHDFFTAKPDFAPFVHVEDVL